MEKQLVVRTFEPDMNALKQTAKQLAHMQDTSLNLYGQAGEVLIVVTARAYAQAAATELTENVAEQFHISREDMDEFAFHSQRKAGGRADPERIHPCCGGPRHGRAAGGGILPHQARPQRI